MFEQVKMKFILPPVIHLAQDMQKRITKKRIRSVVNDA